MVCRRASCWAAFIWASACLMPPVEGSAASEQRIYVTAIDARGQPVAGLGIADFAVDLDGARQEVTRVEPARDPLALVILTDRLGLNSAYTAYDVRMVLSSFVRAMRASEPGPALALTTFDGMVIRVTEFFGSAATLDRALGRLATSTADAVLLDGVLDAADALARAPSDRRVIFTLLAAYRPDQSNVKGDRALERLRTSGASLWAVEARQASGANFGNVTREQVLDVGSQLSGGARVTVASLGGVTSAVDGMAALLRAQYALTYGPGGSGARSRLTVIATRPGVTVIAPRWLPS